MKRLMLITALIALLGPPALAQRTVYVSPDVPTDDPGGSGTVFLPWDVVAYQGGIWAPAPVVSLPPYTPLDALPLTRASPTEPRSVRNTVPGGPGALD